MFTAEDAKKIVMSDLDEKLEYAVKNRRQGDGAYVRINSEDWFSSDIENILKQRGFVNIQVPNWCYF